MRIEYDLLMQRYLRLLDFGLSEQFRMLHPERRKRMERQGPLMLEYLHVLGERIDEAKAQHKVQQCAEMAKQFLQNLSKASSEQDDV